MSPLPRSAFVLGFAGLLPAAAALIGALAGPADWRGWCVHAGATYAAIILGFLGGTWWGLATRAPVGGQAPLFAVAVLPSLGAWGGLLEGGAWGTVAIGAILLAAPLIDARLREGGLTPPNWLRLRVPLSAGLGVLTIGLGLIVAS